MKTYGGECIALCILNLGTYEVNGQFHALALLSLGKVPVPIGTILASQKNKSECDEN